MKHIQDITCYDEAIKQAHARYELPYNWHMLKAQLFQESLLDPEACSPVGARGLAQFMPATWNEYIQKCGFPEDTKPTDAIASIECCARYMSDLLHGWNSPRPYEDRYKLALASYNAGFGNLLKAQKAANNARGYRQIIRKLPIITGRANAEQTANYVERIYLYYQHQNEGAI